jgi:hypothetical protein
MHAGILAERVGQKRFKVENNFAPRQPAHVQARNPAARETRESGFYSNVVARSISNPCQVRALVEITVNAAKRQIIEIIAAAMKLPEDVFDVKPANA